MATRGQRVGEAERLGLEATTTLRGDAAHEQSSPAKPLSLAPTFAEAEATPRDFKHTTQRRPAS